MKLKHRRRKNGQCYAACPACAKEQRQTQPLVAELFLNLGQQCIFSLGFGHGIASVRWPREEYLKMARSLPEPFRNLALAVPDWSKPESWEAPSKTASTV